MILDPPAFAQTRSGLAGAIRGYKEINFRALSLLRAADRNGYLPNFMFYNIGFRCARLD